MGEIKYVKPIIEIIPFVAEDVITTSGDAPFEGPEVTLS